MASRTSAMRATAEKLAHDCDSVSATSGMTRNAVNRLPRNQHNR